MNYNGNGDFGRDKVRKSDLYYQKVVTLLRLCTESKLADSKP
jgi:hypothetical protein